jgi:hypothetical protein
MQTRIYVVINKQDQSKRLVEASTAAQAIRHCVRTVYTAKVAGTKEVAGLMRSGYAVEVAGDETPAASHSDAEQPEAVAASEA